ncbi:MAG: extracellular solute-binding protein [Treponema sp.]|nr:extracellular solute-binding protein [Treponema sp.]
MNRIRTKKIIALSAVLLFSTVFAFAGGSSQSATKSGSTPAQVFTVKVWGGVPAENGPQAAVDAFNAEFKSKGIQAEYTRFVNDNNGNLQLETNLLSGDSVDVYANYDLTPFTKRIESNMAVEQGPLIARDKFDIAGFGEENVARWYVNGKLYGFPTTNNGAAYCTMLNKDMFDAAGIPIPTKWTYSQFRDIAKKLTKGDGANKVYGVFINSGQDINHGLFYSLSLKPDWQYGPDNKSSRYNQEPAVKESLQFTLNLMNVDKSAPTYADNITQKLTQEGMFLSGRAAMTFGAWIVRNVKDTVNFPHNFVTAFAPYPVSDIYPAISNPGGVGDVWAINPKSKNIDACWEYIKWYSTKGIVAMAAGGRLGLYKGLDQKALTDAFLKGSEKLLDPVSTQSAYIAPRPNIAYNKITYKAPELNQIWKETVEAIYNGKMTIDAGLADCQARADKVLAQ